jgi:hypothetical protein
VNNVKDYSRLVVFGCSLTKDNYIATWPDILSSRLNLPLVNYAERGAGYTYILQKLLSININKSDLVIIMWPSADRFDLYVNEAVPHLIDDVEHTSWLNGKESSFINYSGHYQKNNGWYINGAVPRGFKHYYYKYFYTQTFHVNCAWATIVSAQNYLENIGVNYYMCNSYPLTNLIQYHNDGVEGFNQEIYKKINLNKFTKYSDKAGFICLAKNKKFDFFNQHYPNSDAHEWFADNYIIPIICNA